MQGMVAPYLVPPGTKPKRQKSKNDEEGAIHHTVEDTIWGNSFDLRARHLSFPFLLNESIISSTFLKLRIYSHFRAVVL
jgi:hypothetical protein